MSFRNHGYAIIAQCYLTEKLKAGSTEAMCRKNAVDAATTLLNSMLTNCPIQEGEDRRKGKTKNMSPRGSIVTAKTHRLNESTNQTMKETINEPTKTTINQ